MRRFAFFDRDTVHSTILPCLDITAASSGRGSVILGDSEGHVIFVNRDWGCTAIQAYKTRVNAIAQVKSCDVVVTIGDGADYRSSFQRSQARNFILAVRKTVRDQRDKEVRKKQQKNREDRNDSRNEDDDNNDDGDDNERSNASSRRSSRNDNEDDNDDNNDDDDNGTNDKDEENTDMMTNEFTLAESNRDIGYIYGLGIPLEGVTSALVRGDSSWDSGASLPLPSSAPLPEPLLPCATLKVWRLDKRDPRTGNPECVRTMKVFPSGPYGKDRSLGERIVTSLAVSEDLTQVAIGCGDGTVLLLRGDLLKGGNSSRNSERNSRLGVAIGLAMNMGTNLKPQILYEGTLTGTESFSSSSTTSSGKNNDTSTALSTSTASSVYGMTNDAITYLSYTAHADPSLSSEPDSFASKANTNSSSTNARSRHRTMLCLFATSMNRIRCYFPTEIRPLGMGRGWTPNEYIIDLDDTGCIAGCASVTDNGELVVGNDTGIFFYSYEERRASYVFPGRKQRLAWFRGYLVLAAEDSGNMVGGALGIGNVPATANNPYGRNNLSSNAPSVPSVTVTIYDLRSKYIAYGMSLGAAAAAASAGMRMNANLMNGRIIGTMNNSNVANIGQYVRYILCEWGTVFVLIGSGTLDNPYGALTNTTTSSTNRMATNNALSNPPLSIYQLIEKDTGTKVEHLCRLHLFDMAASIAAAAHYGTDNLADIYKLHGDYLYSKGDYDGSVTQYVRTIGAVEPSYVIRRFLDSTRIMNLTTYLEALHAENKATVDHTTLLLNCYTKTKSQEKLRDFIRGEGNAAARKHPHSSHSSKDGAHSSSSSSATTASSSTLTFDVRVAIAVLRDAGCYSDALFLAEKQGEDDLVLAILIEDSGKEENNITPSVAPTDGSDTTIVTKPTNAATVSDSTTSTLNERLRNGVLSAIRYLRRLPFIDAEFYIRQYGRSLVCTCPAETTEVICMLCTKWIRDKPYVAGTLGRTVQSGNGKNDANDPFKKERTRVDSADVFLSLFVDQPLWLKRFCDYLITKANTNEVPKPSQAIWHSLLEVNLRKDSFLATVQSVSLATSSSSSSSATTNATPTISDKDINDTAWDTWRDEVVLTGILRNLSANYDTPTALHLCSSHNYRNGIQYLYERLGMYPLVLASLMDAAETARSNGKHADAKALRREIIRKAKQFTDTSNTALGTAGTSGASGSSSTSSSMGTENIAGIWVSILRYLARSYLSEQGTCVIPSSVPGQRPTIVSYPILTSPSTVPGGGTLNPPNPILTREREEQDSLLQDVLKHIDRTAILPALTVLTLLADCPHIPFGVMRDYITRRLTIDTDKCNDDAKEIESFRTETEAMLNEINRLDTQPKLFQSRKCRLCNQDLELPSVHFMCGGLISTNGTNNGTNTSNAGGSTNGSNGTVIGEEHSFHQHCVLDAMNAQFGTGGTGGNDSSSSSSALPTMECPLCSYSQKQIKSIRASLGPRSGLSEQFYHELEHSNDGFSKAAEYLSKGIF